VARAAKLSMAGFRFVIETVFKATGVCRIKETLRPAVALCHSGDGFYPPILTMYGGEIASKHMLASRDPKVRITHEKSYDIQSTTHGSICRGYMLHTYPGDHRLFSKYQYGLGAYKNYDMKDLDVTMIPGFSGYLALAANNQGINRDILEKRIPKTFRYLCDDEKLFRTKYA